MLHSELLRNIALTYHSNFSCLRSLKRQVSGASGCAPKQRSIVSAVSKPLILDGGRCLQLIYDTASDSHGEPIFFSILSITGMVVDSQSKVRIDVATLCGRSASVGVVLVMTTRGDWHNLSNTLIWSRVDKHPKTARRFSLFWKLPASCGVCLHRVALEREADTPEHRGVKHPRAWSYCKHV